MIAHYLVKIWDLGDGAGAAVASTAHVYSSNGSYEVSLEVENIAQCRDTSMDTVTLKSVGIGTNRNNSDIPFRAYPNPFSEEVTVHYDLSSVREEVKLIVEDQLGRLIQRQEQGSQQAGEHTYKIEALQDVPAGKYFIRLLSDGEQQFERVLKVE